MAAFAAVVLAALLAALPAAAQTRPEAAAARDVVAETLSAIVRVRASILPDARSADTLGDRREGSGVLVREDLVATIGYLVIESEAIEVTGGDGRAVPAVLAAYDHASGFGVLKLLAPMAGKPLPIGDAAALDERHRALVAGFGGEEAVSLVTVVSRRSFAGGWEYLLDSAIYTMPAVPNWSGAALIDSHGELVGLGSLIVGDAAGLGRPTPGNLFVPADLLRRLVAEAADGTAKPAAARPWLGMNTEEMRGRLVVTRVSPGGPADKAGVRAGDMLIAVGADEVRSLEEFYRKLWALGLAGIDVPLRMLQGADINELRLRSIDRLSYFRTRPSY